MAAGAAGGDEDFACGVRPGSEIARDFWPEATVVNIERDGACEGFGLLVDFAQHCVSGMRKIGHPGHCIGSSAGAFIGVVNIAPVNRVEWGVRPSGVDQVALGEFVEREVDGAVGMHSALHVAVDMLA